MVPVTDCTVTGNNTFCVSSRMNARHSYTLVANDELDKRHWLQKLNAAKSKFVSGRLHDTRAAKARQGSTQVARSVSSCCEDIDASFSSISSAASLTSAFSFKSASTVPPVGSFMSSCRAGNIKDADTDSGIVT